MKGYRTLATSAVIAVLGAVQQADLTTVVPPGYEGLALSVVGALMAGLRYATSSPVGKAG